LCADERNSEQTSNRFCVLKTLIKKCIKTFFINWSVKKYDDDDEDDDDDDDDDNKVKT
jgi:hypothetical protein